MSPGQSRHPAASTGSGEATEGENEDPLVARQAEMTGLLAQRGYLTLARRAGSGLTGTIRSFG